MSTSIPESAIFRSSNQPSDRVQRQRGGRKMHKAPGLQRQRTQSDSRAHKHGSLYKHTEELQRCQGALRGIHLSYIKHVRVHECELETLGFSASVRGRLLLIVMEMHGIDRRQRAESNDSQMIAGRFSMFSICSAVSSVKGKVTVHEGLSP